MKGKEIIMELLSINL